MPAFEDGDTVVFLGDSITHSRKWHRYIADYYTTHFPDRSIRYINAGISGDTAPGALKRLDRDVLDYHPTVVVILLGMNDVPGRLYSPEGASSSVLEQRKAALEVYKTAMREIVTRIQASGVRRIILVSPTPYDDTAKLSVPDQTGKNEGLGQAGELVRELAADTHSDFVDFHGPMTELLREQQAVSPTFSLNPADRVHPGEAGNLIMAWLFLRAQDAKPTDTVHLREEQGSDCTRCSIKNVSRHEAQWEFDLLERSLPLPIDSGAKPALSWRPVEQELGAEILQVDGVEPGGSYTVSIDGARIGTYGAVQLQTGIDLGENPLTPQYQQAAAVISLDEEWRARASSLRDVEKVRDSILIPAGKENLTLPQTEEFLQEWLKRQREKDPQGAVYYTTLIPKALATIPHVAEIKVEIAEKQREAHHAAATKWHHVRIEPSEKAQGH